MRGHIRRRGSPGTWTITYEVGKQPAQRCVVCGHRFWLERRPLPRCQRCGGELTTTSERRQKTEGGFARKKDAEAALHKVIEGMNGGTYVAPSKMTLGQYLNDLWLPSLKSSKLRPTTFVSYETHVVHHLTPGLGATPLQKLNRQLIAAHYAWLAENGRVPQRKSPKPKEEKQDVKPGGTRRRRKSKKPKLALPAVNTALSPTTVRRVHATLHRALRDAVRDNLVPRNPADDVEFPEAVKHDRVLNAWNSEQLRTFLASTDGDCLRPLWLLYATTGARRGELLGLTWEDVDLTAGTITLRRALVTVGYTVAVSKPKTKVGQRTIAVPASVRAVLRRHKATQDAEKMLHRDVWGKDRPEGLGELDLVFANEIGRELHPDRVSKLFQKAVTRSKLPRISLHGLRHTFATVALMEGKQPVSVVSARLGHSKASVTLDFYAHAMPRDDEAASEVVAALVVPEGF